MGEARSPSRVLAGPFCPKFLYFFHKACRWLFWAKSSFSKYLRGQSTQTWIPERIHCQTYSFREQRADSEHCCKMKTFLKIELRVRFSRESRKLGSERGVDGTAPLHGFDLRVPAAFWVGRCLSSPPSPWEWSGVRQIFVETFLLGLPWWPTKNLCFQYRPIPGQGTKIPQARQYGKKKKNSLSYSDPAGKNSLRRTAGCTPDWNISSQTRSPPSSALLHPAEDGFQSPPFSSGLLSGRHWQKTDLSFETWLPSGSPLSAQLLLKPWSIPSPEGSVQFSHAVVSDSLQPHKPQHARPPCPSPTPRSCSNSCPTSRWCHPTISSSFVPFSSCLQSFPTSRSFQMSQLITTQSTQPGEANTVSLPSPIPGTKERGRLAAWTGSSGHFWRVEGTTGRHPTRGRACNFRGGDSRHHRDQGAAGECGVHPEDGAHGRDQNTPAVVLKAPKKTSS